MNLSPLIATCEKVWKSIQEYAPDVPDVVIVVGSGGRRASSLLGHFAKNSWGGETPEEQLHEVLLVAENLNRSAEEVFTTLIHEAAHGIAHVRGIKDVSGVRHNRKFAMICEELAMMPPENPDAKLGFSAATLTDPLLQIFSGEIAMIEDELKICRKIFVKESKTNKTTWVAKCQCDRKVRLPKKTIVDPTDIGMICEVCGSNFFMSDEEIDSFNDLLT